MPKILHSPNLSKFSNLIHGFTTKELGNDYDRIAQEIKVLPSQIYSLKQIHSTRVVYMDRGMDLVHLPEGDALVTDRKDIIIGVKTADCVPILLYDEVKEVIAAVHAGYRGLVNGVIQEALRIMTASLHCCLENIHAAIGPAISEHHYEVGDEVIEEFKTKYRDRFKWSQRHGGRPHLDLKGTAQMVLQECGLDLLHIMDLHLCTYEHADLFFSYRRQKSEGRQFNFIGMVS
ncbi:MAG: peptidoglycan editing factor PgeF [Deltaproteobacteria bacterium]|nr:peptidoglycan editing factor PgeF [Deltaproteobacteria bacterium]